jgi:hypothetical protein
VNTIYKLHFKSLCICDVNCWYLHIKQTEISQKQSEQTKIFRISYYIISEVLKKEMIKIIEVRGTLIMVLNMLCVEISCGSPTNYKHVGTQTLYLRGTWLKCLHVWYLNEVSVCYLNEVSVCYLNELVSVCYTATWMKWLRVVLPSCNHWNKRRKGSTLERSRHSMGSDLTSTTAIIKKGPWFLYYTRLTNQMRTKLAY